MNMSTHLLSVGVAPYTSDDWELFGSLTSFKMPQNPYKDVCIVLIHTKLYNEFKKCPLL